ncbi:LuxR C-terminal-related transcriptional regulator [Nocardia sp. NPDC060249]|uniref:LuxR C-terminal-related transcriptional regulator n=1 Tax=unclassified Nocardia TaxID=2637762 RepID=UPI003649EE25
MSVGPVVATAPSELGLIAPQLSPREVEVLLTWIRVDTKSDVGKSLHIAIGTVNTHLARIRDKFAAVDRAAPTKALLLARALQDGLIQLDEL